MAGFAVVMTFLFFGFVGLVGSIVTSISLIFYSRNRVPLTGRKSGTVTLTIITPFLAFFWLIAAFVLHVLISNNLAHQDCGFGLSPDPWVTLPNGYKLGSNNTYDGYIAAPNMNTAQPVIGDGYVRSIIKLKWKEPYFIGTQFDFNSGNTRAFIHDTRTHTTITSDSNLDVNDVTDEGAKNLDAWTYAQSQTHFDADSYWVMYAQNRRQWPKFIFLALVLIGEGAIVIWLWKTWSGSSIQVVENVAN